MTTLLTVLRKGIQAAPWKAAVIRCGGRLPADEHRPTRWDRPSVFTLFAVMALSLLTCLHSSLAAPSGKALRDIAKKAQANGNYKDAYAGFRTLLVDEGVSDAAGREDLISAVLCLNNINQVHEIDGLLEAAVTKNSTNPYVLAAAAKAYSDANHFGYIVGDIFNRGWARGGSGETYNSLNRDRVRAIQLYQSAISQAAGKAPPAEHAAFYASLADALMLGGEAWRLGSKTDVAELPDFSQGYHYDTSGNLGAPVDERNNPIFYGVPADFDAAKNDGERWRWALAMAAKVDPASESQQLLKVAQFFKQQFDVQSLRANSFYRWPADDDDDTKKSTFNLSTLSDKETIAKLATGPRRFELPDEFNFILLFREIAASSSDAAVIALDSLVATYSDRRQYPKAVTVLQEAIRRFGAGTSGQRQKLLDQMVGAWGEFQPTSAFAAGAPIIFDFKFRNASSVTFEAQEIKIEKLLEDTMQYLASNPRNFQWNEVNVQNIGYRLVSRGDTRYLGKNVAQWTQALEARPNHFDTRVNVTAPFSKAGAYLVTAKVAGGNTTKIVVWLNDTALVKKATVDGTMYYAADAATGKPLARATVELFGYKQESIQRNVFFGRSYDIKTSKTSAPTNENGIAVFKTKELDTSYQWLSIVRGENGRLAYQGFQGIWYGAGVSPTYDQVKVYGISDRPVYRPKQKVQYKIWARRASYGDGESSPYSGQSTTIEITNPNGEKVESKSATFDRWGGVAGELSLPENAQLGVYQVYLANIGYAATFRVEEYKKPEFEVTVKPPLKPAALGDKVPVTIAASYYFGAPVSKGKLHYKVQRSNYSAEWFPPSRWDWLYGSGYWWFAPTYNWYRGWGLWGCDAPWPWWRYRNTHLPPELVVDRTVDLSADGTFTFEIDTEIAKALFSDSDHRYQVTAEVVDESRRTIVATGSVLVARKPFSVYTWLDRGYYRPGDTIKATINARTIDSIPVSGKGKATLYQISYDAKREPQEKAVQNWDLPTNADGQAQLQMTAAKPGQYRFSYELSDDQDRKIEGAYVFSVVGSASNAEDFRFNAIEIVPEKKEYAPGETVKLLVNSDQPDATVLLFLRAANGRYLAPEIINLKGRSTVYEFKVVKDDMPNFFVEAITVHHGELHTATREIVVPPEDRVLDVKVVPSAKEYKPGTEASVEIIVTDPAGRPLPSTAAITVYDRSVEYISGGAGASNIRDFYWKWRRSHQEQSTTNLAQVFAGLTPPNATPMQPLGAFGASVADEESDQFEEEGNRSESRRDRMQAPAPMKSKGLAEPAMGLARGAELLDQKLSDKNEAGAFDGASPPQEAEVQPAIRKEFADTAYWNGLVEINERGRGTVTFRMPENLTGWKIRSWALGAGTRVGEGTVEITTSKKVLVRAQTPRFLVEKDEVVLSANVHNYLATSKRVRVKIETPGSLLEPVSAVEQTVEIASQGTARVDWRFKVRSEGEAIVRMSAITDVESDAMEVRVPVKVRGILKTESFSAVVRPDQDRTTLEFTVPEERRMDQSRIEVRYSPSLALSMVDALPYLANYPYGCTEQTLNRFVPTVVTLNELKRLGVSLEDIRTKRTNLNAQEIGDAAERAKHLKMYPINPVFDEKEVLSMTKAGITRLHSMQMSDGGWGWFSGYGERSSAHTTATVVHGLQVARQAGAAIPPEMIKRGVDWLAHYEASQLTELRNAKTKTQPFKTASDSLDVLVHLVLVDEKLGKAEMRDFLYRDRLSMPVYAKVLQGLIFDSVKDIEKRDMLLTNISQLLVQDDENQTAHLNIGNENWWWYWYGSETEAMAYYVKLLSRVDPKGQTVSRLVKYLVNNRRNSTYWNSTRDTALVVEAFGEFIKASGQDYPDLTLEVMLDGKKVKEVQITRANLFNFDGSFVLTGKDVTSGKHSLSIVRKGRGEVYVNAYVTNFTQEDPITKAGLEIKVERTIYRLTADKDATSLQRGAKGQAVEVNVEKFVREKLASMADVKSGDLLEVELIMESKNDYEYVVFEDFKPAGVEPVSVQSGYSDNALGAYVEYRDDKVAFFVRQLPRGKRSVSYRVRAETPGLFSALPTMGSAMYAPELRANSDEFKLGIRD